VTRRRWLLASVLLVAGCTGGSSTSYRRTEPPSASAPASAAVPTTAPPPTGPTPGTSTEPAPAAGSRDFGYLTAVVGSAPLRLSFDRAQFLTGDAADKAAAAHGDETPVPNDYYIVNDSPRLRTLTVAGDVAVFGSLGLNSFVGDNEVQLRRRTVSDLLGYLRTPPGRATGFQLVYGARGVVVRIEEQYQP
jgi:hypothetical protein